MVDCSKCKNADRCEAWDIDKVRRTGECEVYEPIDNAKFDVFAEIKKRAEAEVEGLRKASAKTDDTNEKYKYRKIRVGIEAMLEHVYEVEEEYKKQKVKTWGDKIRSMSDEELAEFLHNIGSFIEDGEPLIEIYIGENKSLICDSVGFIEEWLQSEAE